MLSLESLGERSIQSEKKREKRKLSIKQKVMFLKNTQIADLAAFLTRLTGNAVAGTPSHADGIAFACSNTL